MSAGDTTGDPDVNGSPVIPGSRIEERNGYADSIGSDARPDFGWATLPSDVKYEVKNWATKCRDRGIKKGKARDWFRTNYEDDARARGISSAAIDRIFNAVFKTEPRMGKDGDGTWLGDAQRRTDDGNALLFVTQHVEQVRFAIDVKRWHAWDGTRWVPDADTQVLDLARETARSLGQLAAQVKDDDERGKALRHASTSLSAAKIQAVPTLAKSDPRVAVKAGDFDSDPWRLNTPSGTVDLRTGELRSHRREDFNAKVTGVPYDPTAQADYWMNWLHWASCGRPDWVEHLQRALGYALSGDTGEQVFWLLYGSGANGKSTFLAVMEAILGDYAWHAEPNLLTPRDGASTTGVADLQGKRFVVATETKEGKRLDERQVKQLTGQDTITARRLYQDHMTFRPTHKIFFAVNHKPNVTDTSHAFWRRVLLVPWDSTVPDEMKRRDVADWIVEHNGPGVLRWAVEGCIKWQRDGLAIPDYVRAETERYRHTEDAVGAFIDACLIQEDDAWANTNDVWQSYKTWCEQERVSNCLGRTKLLGEMERRLAVVRTRFMWQGAKAHGWRGWRVVGIEDR